MSFDGLFLTLLAAAVYLFLLWLGYRIVTAIFAISKSLDRISHILEERLPKGDAPPRI